MERKIIFRGKSLKNKKWVYGDLMSNICGTRIVRYKETDNGATKRADWNYIDVEPDSVGQFTGLTDCNGKEIYEGDIVRYYDDIEDCLVSSHVIYYKEFGSFCIAPTELCGDYVGLAAHWQFEVIGNIHDNPSLIPNQPTAI